MGEVDRITSLFHAIEKHNRPFQWGESDCCLFAANVVEEITGIDYAKGFRGYDSRNGAVKKLRELGFSSLEQAISSVLKPKNKNFAMRGDVVLIRNAGRHIAGICVGEKAACQGKDGIVYLNGFLKAWSAE